MPTEDAYSSGHLVLSHFGTCMCSNVETNLSWTCLVSGLLNFEHPSVLLFCLVSHVHGIGKLSFSKLILTRMQVEVCFHFPMEVYGNLNYSMQLKRQFTMFPSDNKVGGGGGFTKIPQTNNMIYSMGAGPTVTFSFISINKRPNRAPEYFFGIEHMLIMIWMKNTNFIENVLASFQITLNRIQRLQRRSRKYLGQSDAGATISVYWPQNTNFVDNVKMLPHVKSRWIPFSV